MCPFKGDLIKAQIDVFSKSGGNQRLLAPGHPSYSVAEVQIEDRKRVTERRHHSWKLIRGDEQSRARFEIGVVPRGDSDEASNCGQDEKGLLRNHQQ